MLDTHTALFPFYCFSWSAAAVDVGAQEQEYPGGAYYDAKYPADQEYVGVPR